jgi:hypothetical protein
MNAGPSMAGYQPFLKRRSFYVGRPFYYRGSFSPRRLFYGPQSRAFLQSSRRMQSEEGWLSRAVAEQPDCGATLLTRLKTVV